MRYSLGNRFRGTLVGAVVGESLTIGNECCGKMAILGGQSLIALGRLDLDDWLKASLNLDPTENLSLQAVVATLPIALFFHDNTIKLRENLLHVVQRRENDPVVRDGVLAVGYALAMSLTEKLEPKTLIPEIISFLGETDSRIPEKLLIVNSLLEGFAGLEKAKAELSREEKLSNAIAMAFYCFLSSLEDFRLSVLRANRLSPDSQLISIITGALSGAYNTSAGIPLNWRSCVSQANSTASGLTSYKAMVKLADALLAVWSGVYNLAPDTSQFQKDLCAIAAPRVMRLR